VLYAISLRIIPLPKEPLRLPITLSVEEVTRLIDAARNLMHPTILMMLYSTGVRRAELYQLKVSDIDKEWMVIHIHRGNAARPRCRPSRSDPHQGAEVTNFDATSWSATIRPEASR
jgi:integrase